MIDCGAMDLCSGTQLIARHVMNIHMNRPNHNADENGESVGEIDIDKMKRYISYCKRWVRHDDMR
jgi:DNA replicative helicase MCM subunit Mcm2 (Cdc46/Mcm family)